MTVIGLMHRLPDGSWVDPGRVVRVWVWKGSWLSIHVTDTGDGFGAACSSPEAAETALADLIRACDTARMAAMTPEQRQYYAERLIAPDE